MLNSVSSNSCKVSRKNNLDETFTSVSSESSPVMVVRVLGSEQWNIHKQYFCQPVQMWEGIRSRWWVKRLCSETASGLRENRKKKMKELFLKIAWSQTFSCYPLSQQEFMRA